MNNSQKLKDKVYIITGATSGMGKEIAIKFAEEGASLIINGRDLNKGLAVLHLLEQFGNKAYFIPGDVSEESTNDRLINCVVENFGKLDGFVSSAGILGLGKIVELDDEIWKKTLGTNLDSVYYLSKKSIPLMIQSGGGNIVVIGSIASEKVFPSHPAYCASKAAVLALTRQIALDYGPEIKANSINPGPVDTPLLWDSAKGFPDPATAVDNARQTTALKALGTPKDIAELALFLVSEKNQWITGSAITIDGGKLLY